MIFKFLNTITKVMHFIEHSIELLVHFYELIYAALYFLF